LDLPEAVIVPGQDVIGIGFERALVPDLRHLVVTELAIGIADQVGDVGVIVAIVDRVVGALISLNEGGLGEEGLLAGLLALVAGANILRRLCRGRDRRWINDIRTGGVAAAAASSAATRGKSRRCQQRSGQSDKRYQPDR